MGIRGVRRWESALLLCCLWQMDDPSVGPKIPQALEKILQLKESRQEEMNSQQGEWCVLELQPRAGPRPDSFSIPEKRTV